MPRSRDCLRALRAPKKGARGRLTAGARAAHGRFRAAAGPCSPPPSGRGGLCVRGAARTHPSFRPCVAQEPNIPRQLHSRKPVGEVWGCLAAHLGGGQPEPLPPNNLRRAEGRGEAGVGGECEGMRRRRQRQARTCCNTMQREGSDVSCIRTSYGGYAQMSPARMARRTAASTAVLPARAPANHTTQLVPVSKQMTVLHSHSDRLCALCDAIEADSSRCAELCAVALVRNMEISQNSGDICRFAYNAPVSSSPGTWELAMMRSKRSRSKRTWGMWSRAADAVVRGRMPSLTRAFALSPMDGRDNVAHISVPS
eukprot:SAG11_NODE_2772_length_2988_cov_3.337487_1_plen_312_part_00